MIRASGNTHTCGTALLLLLVLAAHSATLGASAQQVTHASRLTIGKTLPTRIGKNKVRARKEKNKQQSNARSRQGCQAQGTLTCQLIPTAGNRARGTVTFAPQFWASKRPGSRCVVVIEANVRYLKPGSHGFHIHTYGDLRQEDGMSTGGHLTSPKDARLPHGGPDDPRRHWGDFGNITAWKRGNAHYRRVDHVISLAGIVGRAMVVHASPDKGVFDQPSGGAGARQCSCVIGFANPDYK